MCASDAPAQLSDMNFRGTSSYYSDGTCTQYRVCVGVRGRAWACLDVQAFSEYFADRSKYCAPYSAFLSPSPPALSPAAQTTLCIYRRRISGTLTKTLLSICRTLQSLFLVFFFCSQWIRMVAEGVMEVVQIMEGEGEGEQEEEGMEGVLVVVEGEVMGIMVGVEVGL